MTTREMIGRRCVWAATGLCAMVGPAYGEVKATYRPENDRAIEAWLTEHLDAVVELYKTVHANPELSLQEQHTAALVAGRFRDAGYEVTTEVGGTGVVGVMHNGEGPTLLIRGDMDALPVSEETGLPYASRVRMPGPDGTTVGVMHACGHDVHVANLIATARLLADLRSRWRGTVLVVGQPAEEVGKGASMMIEDGLFERFGRPEVCLSLHVSHELPAGRLGCTPGWGYANVDSVDITVFGRGGHGARPHQAVDPVVASAYLITNLQTLVSRRVNPIEPAVVTVGSIHGGSKHNIIADQVKLQLTVRSYSAETRKLLLDGIRQLAEDTCATFGCPRPPEVEVKDEHTPAAYNDPELTAAAMGLFRQVFGAQNVVEMPPTMGGEDFGLYARHLKVPGLQFRIGAVDRDRYEASQRPGGPQLPSLHSARFAPAPEPTLRTGIRATANLALALLAKPDLSGASVGQQKLERVELTEEASRIHQAAIVIDGHNDLPWQIRSLANSSFDSMDIALPQDKLQTDIPRLRQGGLGGQFWVVYVPPETARTGTATSMALEQFELIHRMVKRYPEVFELAYTAQDVVRIHKDGKLASLIGVEGGHTIENSLDTLARFYALGARYMGLTHSETIDWADSATDEPRSGGLSAFGEQVVLEMNRLGMLVDLAHVSAETMRDALRVSKAPVIFSHSSAYAIARHDRNVPDDVLRMVAKNGGVVMVNFFSGYIHPQGARIIANYFQEERRLKAEYPDQQAFERAWMQWKQAHPIPHGNVGTLVDHIDHIVRVAGIDHVGLGGDYDGASTMPEQLEDVSGYPYITQELLNRGYAERDIHKILGGNLLRVLRQAEQVAGSWRD